MMIHNKEEQEALEVLNTVLFKFINQYDSDPAKTGLRSNKDGSFTVEIDKGPDFWFSNETELAAWVLGVANAN